MKTGKPGRMAFTLLEMLAVISIVGFLSMLLVPTLVRSGDKARRVRCLSNLRQVGIAFHSFLPDHGDSFPMDVSTNSGGTYEILTASYLAHGDSYLAYAHFQALSNELANPAVLVCPADRARAVAGDFSSLGNQNVSYFVGANADVSLPNSLLAGDRNILPAGSSARALVRLNADNPAGWTREVHGLKGDQLFADGHVERVNGRMVKLPKRNAPIMMDLLLPALKPAPPPPSALASAEARGSRALDWQP